MLLGSVKSVLKISKDGDCTTSVVSLFMRNFFPYEKLESLLLQFRTVVFHYLTMHYCEKPDYIFILRLASNERLLIDPLKPSLLWAE